MICTSWTCDSRTPADEIWTKWPEEFVFENFNAKETVATAKRGGFRYIVAIAKHHEGFHLWDTDHSDFNVMNTPFMSGTMTAAEMAAS